MAASVAQQPMSTIRTTAGPAVAPNSELDRLAPAEADRWRSRLQRTARPCGCKSGAALALAALVVWPVWTFMSGPPQTAFGVGLATVTYAFLVVISGVVGKVAGIVVGRRRHQRTRAQLAQRLALVRQAPEG
jgi:hypothetical protein